MNKLLWVDLGRREYRIDTIPDTIMDEYLGGRGLGAYLLYKNLPAKIDPFSPENLIILSSGPAQGTSTFYSSRAVLNTKSPLTGCYLYTVSSGRIGHAIKEAGYAAIMIRGRADKPTYLAINDDDIQFRAASSMWGLKTIEAMEALTKDSQLKNSSCVVIGPAGERLMKMALVATEGENVRTFGRGGSGAVFGAKNLKGVVVSGTHKPRAGNESAFLECKKMFTDLIKGQPGYVEMRRRFGTGSDMDSMSETGILPTRNWQTGVFKKLDGIDLKKIEETWPRKNIPCGPYCINPCAHTITLEKGPWKGTHIEGPEYETLYAFGSNCDIDRFDAIVAAEKICNDYGIDTMSCGLTISLAMECYEKGLLSKEDTGGIDLRFGNAEGMVDMVRLIAEGKGVGEFLGEGAKRVSEKISGSEGFAMHCKGLEFGGYECRGLWGQALQFALSSRGGCHHAYGLPARMPKEMEAGTQVKGKGELVKMAAITRILFDSTVMCTFPVSIIGLPNLVKMLNALTGKERSLDDYKKIGFRILTLERMFNVREGFTRVDDYLPKRLTHEPLPDGPNAGRVVPMDEILDEGYQAMGWDKGTGIPLQETLKELGLTEMVV